MMLPKRLLALAFSLTIAYSISAQYNVEIVAGSAAFNINAFSPFNPTGDNAQIGVTEILAALSSGGAVINTNTGGSQAGNITLSTDLDYDGVGSVSFLTFNAEGDITLNGGIFDSSTGDFEVIGISLTSTNGNINGSFFNVISGGGAINLSAPAGNIDINQVSSSSASAGGAISILGNDLSVTNGIISASGAGPGAGDITINLSGALSAVTPTLTIGAVDQNGGNLDLDAAEILTPLDLDFSGPAGGGGNVDIATTNNTATTINALDVSGASAAGDITINVGGSLSIVPN